jgi:hypothetical protein
MDKLESLLKNNGIEFVKTIDGKISIKDGTTVVESYGLNQEIGCAHYGKFGGAQGLDTPEEALDWIVDRQEDVPICPRGLVDGSEAKIEFMALIQKH